MRLISKTISEFLAQRSVGIVGLEENVAQAVSLMRDDDLSCVLVMQDGALAGIFTERDFLTRVIDDDRAFSEIKISEVMTGEPITLASDAGIAFAINEMAVGGFRNLPIVDGNSVQLLTVHDVIQHLAKLFDDLETTATDDGDDSWIDIGGQG